MVVVTKHRQPPLASSFARFHFYFVLPAIWWDRRVADMNFQFHKTSYRCFQMAQHTIKKNAHWSSFKRWNKLKTQSYTEEDDGTCDDKRRSQHSRAKWYSKSIWTSYSTPSWHTINPVSIWILFSNNHTYMGKHWETVLHIISWTFGGTYSFHNFSQKLSSWVFIARISIVVST